MDDISYEAYDPEQNAIIPDVFIAGWSRQASTGLAGYARKDGVNGAKAVLQHLQTLQPIVPDEAALARRLKALGKPVVSFSDIRKLAEIEDEIARQRGSESFKFAHQLRKCWETNHVGWVRRERTHGARGVPGLRAFRFDETCGGVENPAAWRVY